MLLNIETCLVFHITLAILVFFSLKEYCHVELEAVLDNMEKIFSRVRLFFSFLPHIAFSLFLSPGVYALKTKVKMEQHDCLVK